MKKYFLHKNSVKQTIIRLEQTDMLDLWIPTDPANTDYQAYLAWVAEGNTAEEWNPEN